jgi:predicted HTH transcriptional regulator
MIQKDIDQITEKDLQALIDNSVLERRTIEYKRLLPSNSDVDKKEFLADVSSFANASGGDLIYGIIQDKETGAPERLEGLDIKNVDQEILRLDNLIRNGIEPRIPSLAIKPISLSNSRVALIIRINKSWVSPHRVSFKEYDKFYTRGSNGKYPLDVTELRIAFTLAETVAEKIRRFRENRISDVYADETPVPLYKGAKIILQLIPII